MISNCIFQVFFFSTNGERLKINDVKVKRRKKQLVLGERVIKRYIHYICMYLYSRNITYWLVLYVTVLLSRVREKAQQVWATE